MLQSCGVQSGSYPKIEVKKNSSTWPQKSYPDFEILGFPFPKIGLSLMIKVHMFSILGIQTSRRIQHISLID